MDATFHVKTARIRQRPLIQQRLRGAGRVARALDTEA